ncbi:AtpZ/AtpI family protein [Formosa sp. S-31]|uniref:AtpZ/AtpI family protein n=1 Tax=Formosa sp. S-31 TaxID=2790949 RepID=UPI003EC0857B
MKEKPKKQLNNYIKFSTMAFQMVAIIGVLTYLGVWLDDKYPNEYSMFTIIFSLLGVTGAIYMIIKQVTNLNKEE